MNESSAQSDKRPTARTRLVSSEHQPPHDFQGSRVFVCLIAEGTAVANAMSALRGLSAAEMLLDIVIIKRGAGQRTFDTGSSVEISECTAKLCPFME